MKIIKTKNYDELSLVAATIIKDQANQKPDGVLGLATGSTPIGTYKALVNMFNEGSVDFKNIKTANLDEYRGLEKGNDQTYAYFMNDNLFQYVNIDEKNTNIPDGANLDAQAECDKYEETIKNLGGIDLQLLGIGHNGHIGFNEPCDEFSAKTHCVDLDQITIEANARFFATINDVPKQAYTMGIGTIMSAKKILLVATGEEKAEILYKTVFGKVSPEVQSSILQFHPDVTIVADEKALAKIIELCPHAICD